jgi:hypothetical protein
MSNQLVGFRASVPNVTEEEWKAILAEYELKAESLSWREWKNNPLQIPGLKSYKLTVKLKPVQAEPLKFFPFKGLAPNWEVFYKLDKMFDDPARVHIAVLRARQVRQELRALKGVPPL